MVEHAAGLNPRVFLLGVELDDPVQVLGEIDDDGDVAGLSGEAGAAAARQQRCTVPAGEGDGLDDFVDGAGDYNADGDLAVVGAVDSVEGARARVKANFAGDGGAEFGGQDLGGVAGLSRIPIC